MSHVSSGILVSLDFNEREEFSWLFLITNNKKRTCIQESVINESCSSRISHKRILVCLVVFLHNSPIPFILFKLLTKSVNSEVSILLWSLNSEVYCSNTFLSYIFVRDIHCSTYKILYVLKRQDDGSWRFCQGDIQTTWWYLESWKLLASKWWLRLTC
jgi:hypothetical protein